MDYILQGRLYQYQPPNQSTPTLAQPGSAAKLLVMTERHRSGQPIHDPGDAAFITTVAARFHRSLEPLQVEEQSSDERILAAVLAG